MKCFYHNDLDGRCAGAIVYKAMKNQENDGTGFSYIEIDYKDNINICSILKNEQIVIVDFSFKPEIMEEVLKKTKNIIWIDHHKTADEYKYSQDIRGLRITENKKFSGCELTWMYFYPKENMPRAVELIGDRDKWAWKLGEETANFNQGLLSQYHQPDSNIWDNLFTNSEVFLTAIKKEGETCIRFRNSFCKDYADSYGFETDFEGYKCFALGLYMFGSEAFGERFKQYDISLSYEYLGDKWIVGLYSEKIDVGEIAKRYGGGGHIGASGFVCKNLPFKGV